MPARRALYRVQVAFQGKEFPDVLGHGHLGKNQAAHLYREMLHGCTNHRCVHGFRNELNQVFMRLQTWKLGVAPLAMQREGSVRGCISARVNTPHFAGAHWV